MRRITSIGLAAVALVGVLAWGSQSTFAAARGTMDGATKTHSRKHHHKHHHKKHHHGQRTMTQKKSY